MPIRTMLDVETAAAAWLERRFNIGASGRAADFETIIRERYPRDRGLAHLVEIVRGARAPEDVTTAESYALRLCTDSAARLDMDDDAAIDHICFVFDALLASARARITAEEQVVCDPLLEPASGLPNRLLFRDRLSHAIANAHRRDAELALCSVQFDFTNTDGDLPRIVRELADRLKHSVREVDTVARLGHQEFAIVITSLRRRLDASHAVQTAWEMASEPFDVGDRCYEIPVRIGISFYPAHGHDADSLLQSARDAAAVADPVKVFGEEQEKL